MGAQGVGMEVVLLMGAAEDWIESFRIKAKASNSTTITPRSGFLEIFWARSCGFSDHLVTAAALVRSLPIDCSIPGHFHPNGSKFVQSGELGEFYGPGIEQGQGGGPDLNTKLTMRITSALVIRRLQSASPTRTVGCGSGPPLKV